jgi:hypothetical protein
MSSTAPCTKSSWHAFACMKITAPVTWAVPLGVRGSSPSAHQSGARTESRAKAGEWGD